VAEITAKTKQLATEQRERRKRLKEKKLAE
jgi:hypothetical protein